MTTRYGYPPEREACVEREIPKGLLTKVNQAVVRADSEGMVPHLGKPVPVAAVARQLNLAYGFGRNGAVRVTVPGYGEFRIGSEGWCVE